jgi:predicted dehydrogenase
MTHVRFGVLGASNFAREQMAPAIHAAKGAELAAHATSDPAKAEGVRAVCPTLTVHTSYQALLADPTIDAVYIPLPHTLHIEWAMKAMDAGKHVLVEKPIAMQADAIDPVIARRDATDLVCAEAYMIVHHPQWQRAKALLEEGAIGKLIHVGAFFSYDNSAAPQNIRNRPETGGGSLPDIGVYTCGSTRWMTGEEPTEVRAEITRENGVEVTTHMRAMFPTFSFTGTTSMRMHPRQEMVFHGQTGVIRLSAPFNANVFGQAQVELHKGMTVTIDRFPADNHYVLQVEAFCRSVRDGAAYPWALENAKGTQRMIDMAYASEA